MNVPFVEYDKGVEILATQVLLHRNEKPYLATIDGFMGVGKTNFALDVLSEVYFNKRGAVVKEHDLEREFSQGMREYFLIENHGAFRPLMNRRLDFFFDKKPDLHILVVSSFANIINFPTEKIEKLRQNYNLIVENPYLLGKQ